MRITDFGDRERASRAMCLARRAHPSLRTTKIGEDFGEAPAGRTHVCPFVEIMGGSADINLPIYGAAAAQHAPCGPHPASSAQARIRRRLVAPIVFLFQEHLEKTDRQLDKKSPRVTARLDKQYFCLRIFGQPMRDHRAGTARADNDIVRFSKRGFRGIVIDSIILGKRGMENICLSPRGRHSGRWRALWCCVNAPAITCAVLRRRVRPPFEHLPACRGSAPYIVSSIISTRRPAQQEPGNRRG